MDNTLIFKQIYSKILNANNILVLTHENPDADAVSSVCAILNLLEKLNKKYFAYCRQKPPAYLEFLPLSEKISANKNLINFPERDLIIIVDCSDAKRTALEKEIKNRDGQTAISIDHHPKIEDFADLEIKKSVASTTELIYEFYRTNRLLLNKDVATCILTGISEDTGNFIYPSTSEKTIEVSSEMIKAGARLLGIVEQTIRNKNLATLKIWGKAMSRLKINKKYNLAFTALTADDIMDSGVSEEDMEGIAGFLGNLSGVNAVLFLREAGGFVRGSLRSSHLTLDISPLAKILGGGGHAKAAGFKIEGRIWEEDGQWEII